MAKYGDKFDVMPNVDYTFAHDSFYVFENFDETSFGVIEKLDKVSQKDAINISVEVLKDGTIEHAKDYSRRLKNLRSFPKLHDLHSGVAKNPSASTGNVGVDSTVGGYSEGNGLSGTCSDNNSGISEQHRPRTKALTDRLADNMEEETVQYRKRETHKGDENFDERRVQTSTQESSGGYNENSRNAAYRG